MRSDTRHKSLQLRTLVTGRKMQHWLIHKYVQRCLLYLKAFTAG